MPSDEVVLKSLPSVRVAELTGVAPGFDAIGSSLSAIKKCGTCRSPSLEASSSSLRPSPAAWPGPRSAQVA